jgi:hypothetical protein
MAALGTLAAQQRSSNGDDPTLPIESFHQSESTQPCLARPNPPAPQSMPPLRDIPPYNLFVPRGNENLLDPERDPPPHAGAVGAVTPVGRV